MTITARGYTRTLTDIPFKRKFDWDLKRFEDNVQVLSSSDFNPMTNTYLSPDFSTRLIAVGFSFLLSPLYCSFISRARAVLQVKYYLVVAPRVDYACDPELATVVHIYGKQAFDRCVSVARILPFENWGFCADYRRSLPRKTTDSPSTFPKKIGSKFRDNSTCI